MFSLAYQAVWVKPTVESEKWMPNQLVWLNRIFSVGTNSILLVKTIGIGSHQSFYYTILL